LRNFEEKLLTRPPTQSGGLIKIKSPIRGIHARRV
ncbi:MAG: hypothetical protein ACJATF_001330, partial [Flavobacteriales bacterium]